MWGGDCGDKDEGRWMRKGLLAKGRGEGLKRGLYRTVCAVGLGGGGL